MKIQEARQFVRAFRGNPIKRFLDTYREDLDLSRKVFNIFYGVTMGLFDSEADRIGCRAYRTEEEALRILKKIDSSQSEEQAKAILEDLLKSSSVVYKKHDFDNSSFRLERQEDENENPRLKMCVHTACGDVSYLNKKV